MATTPSSTSRARAPGGAELDALTRGADLVARHGRDVGAVSVRLPGLDDGEAEWLEHACELAARERGIEVEIWFGEKRTIVRFARGRGA